jgi:hypothetical protein
MSLRAALARWLVRVALLTFWSLTLWGGLLVAATAWSAAEDGLRPSLARLLPARGASLWAWLNGFCAALAIAVGAGIATLVVWRWTSSRNRGPVKLS